MNRYSRDRGSGEGSFRLLSSSSTTTKGGSQKGGSSDAYTIIPADNSSSSTSLTSQLVPWMVLGFSMGIGYFGLESLLAYCYFYYKKRTSSRRHPLHAQLTNQLQQLKQTLLSFSSSNDIPTSFLHWWTWPVPFLYCRPSDILWGVFITILPRDNDDNDDGKPPHTRHPARVLSSPTTTTSNTTKQQKQQHKSPPQEEGEENDVFLTLPPQLQPRKLATLPPKAPTTTNNTPKKERYLEMLLHNLSHTDLVLGLDIMMQHQQQKDKATTTDDENNMMEDLGSMCLCRPRFSAFDMYCRKLLQALEECNNNDEPEKEEEVQEAEIILVPQYQRSQNDPRHTIQPSDRPHVSTGFCWKSTTRTTTETRKQKGKSSSKNTKQQTTNYHQTTTATANNPRVIPLTQALADLRVRGKDMSKLDPYVFKPTNVTHDDNNNDNDTTSTAKMPSPGTPRVYQDLDELAQEEQERRSSSPTVSSWNVISVGQQQESFSQQQQQTKQTTPRLGASSSKSKDDILVELKAVFFPLLATLLPRWHEQIAQKYSKWRTDNVVQKVLVLVTGVGTPRNWTHSITGNSTQALADLMELFLAKVYPDITVVKIHSDTNIFRYDDNILFVQQELMPCVNAYRDAHATQAPYPHEIISSEGGMSGLQHHPIMTGDNGFEQQLQPEALQAQNAFDVDWKRSFAVTLSFADGSPARTHAIQTALRIFRPTYFHIWQLKTFWHERKIVDDDVEVHSFEEMETSPALESNRLRGELAQVVQEMKAFRQEMTETLFSKSPNDNDIHSFWLRKTHKPVLAVLLVQSEGQPPVLYRGTNMEVSMPTGSLCAERNVIGTALGANSKLKRQDLKCIAVLAVPPPPSTSGSKPQPASQGNASDTICSSCKTSRHNSFDETQTQNSTMTSRQMRRQSFDEKEEEEWTMGGIVSKTQVETVGKEAPTATGTQEEEPPQSHGAPLRQISLFSSQSSNSLVDMIKEYPSGPTSPHTSRGKKPLSTTATNGNAATVVHEKRTIIVRSNNNDVDLNPLSPCGACHEWLKKIAECNPYFQIMTFTDADCNGVYVTPCQE